MNNVVARLIGRLSYSNDLEIVPTNHPHKDFQTTIWVVSVAVFTVFYFLIYNYPVGLHDISHYITAGISQIRDQKDLLYPYHPHAPGGMGPAYEYFQNNSIHFDIRTNYPSKLYSILFGLIYLVTGKMKFLYAQWLSLAAITMCNVLLYLIGSRFFKGSTLACFIITVAFLPVMRFALAPSSDVFGYLVCLVLLWLTICLRVNPFVVGLTAGVLCNFREQTLFIIIILPIIISTLYGRQFLRQVLVPLVSGAAITYSIVFIVYKIYLVSFVSSTGVAFYINHFSHNFYHFSQWGVVWQNLINNTINVFDKMQLFIFAYLALICVFLKNVPLQRKLAISGILYVAFPLLIYSLDHVAPHPRYYMPAVPMLVLAWFIAVNMFGRFGIIRSKSIIVLTTVLVCFSWYNAYGLPIKSFRSFNIVKNRLQFLDFPGLEQALRDNFKDDDVVIINHSLPTGLSRLHNVIYLPPLKKFKAGNNHKINGIIFVYSNQMPNDFFKPNDWLIAGRLPDKITDNNRVSFKKVYAATSQLLGYDGSLESETYFYIYKNTSLTKKPN